MSGILSYGVYLPAYALALEDIASAWEKEGTEISQALKVKQKLVPAVDEDAITMAVMSSLRALERISLHPDQLQSIFIGSESHPYAVNPSSSTVAEFIGMGHNYFAADLEFACKAATTALAMTAGMIDGGQISQGLVIGSDTAQAKPGDIIEYTAASASSAYILGNDPKKVIAHIREMTSYATDTPDFWRREGESYPSHAGRFTGEPAYFHHVMSAAKLLLEKAKMQPADFDYCVFHMPNGKFPRIVAKKLGFTDEQLAPSLVVTEVGNSYTASALVGLSAVLDIAKPKQKIFFVSYGSGAGSDGFIFETTTQITKAQKGAVPVSKLVLHKKKISYLTYLKQTKKFL